jgi:ParB-like chromosome segregation protein Spo0J
MAEKVIMKIHPAAKEMAEWLQVLPSKEAKELKEDIKKNGIQVPILVTKTKDTIIDGRNRWMIAHELGLKPDQVPLEVYKGKDEDIPAIIMSRNALRRHLTKDQRDAVIAAVLAPPIEAAAAESKGGRPKAGTFGKPSGNGGSVAAKLAEKMNVSQRRAEQLEKARRAGTLKRVAQGKKTLRKAAAEAPKKARPRKNGTKKPLANRVWTAFRQLLAKFTHEEHREVKKHLRNYLAGAAEPKKE